MQSLNLRGKGKAMDKPGLPYSSKDHKNKSGSFLTSPWFLFGAGFLLAIFIVYMGDNFSNVHSAVEYAAPSLSFDEAAVRADLEELYKEKNCMPIMVRLAWHDAGTYSKWDKSGGPHAAMRFNPEAAHGANNGLSLAREMLEPIKAKHPTIGYADLYQLAGVVAVAYAGGPGIAFRAGRRDALGPGASTPDGRLPDATKKEDHLRDIFYRMGMDDEEIVALSGAHTLGRCHADRSGFDGAWTAEPLVFDNSYFTRLLDPQDTEGLLLLETDKVLVTEPSFKKHVQRFALNQDVFFEAYAKAHQKLSELGSDL